LRAKVYFNKLPDFRVLEQSEDAEHCIDFLKTKSSIEIDSFWRRSKNLNAKAEGSLEYYLKEKNVSDVGNLNKVITVSNLMSRSFWTTASVWERRFFVIMVKKIREETAENKNALEVSISCVETVRACEEAARELGQRLSYQHLYKTIKTAADNLQSNVVRIYDKTTRSFQQHVVCTSFYWNDETKTATVCFNEKLRDEILNLKRDFTQYTIMEFLRLSSRYSQALFQFLKSWKTENEITSDVSFLHELLEATESHKKNFALFRTVLERALTEINEKTSLDVSMEPIKESSSSGVGRKKYKTIKFSFNKSGKNGKKEGHGNILGLLDSEMASGSNELSKGLLEIARDLEGIDEVRADAGRAIAKELALLSERGLKYTPLAKQDPEALWLDYTKRFIENVEEYELKIDNKKVVECARESINELESNKEWPTVSDFNVLVRPKLYKLKELKNTYDISSEEVARQGLKGMKEKIGRI